MHCKWKHQGGRVCCSVNLHLLLTTLNSLESSPNLKDYNLQVHRKEVSSQARAKAHFSTQLK